MTEPEALQERRLILLDRIAQAADEIKRIDAILSDLLSGRGPGGSVA